MATASRAQPSLSMHLPASSLNGAADIPPISALFLIVFDVKAGYTIVWKQALPGLELEGIVEYKSLPSGLHTVKEDLIYFVHEAGHAGLSAFANVPCDEEDARHARMIAVGVLVPLSFGRLGRAWRHAESLKEMAAKLAVDHKQTEALEAYWEQHRSGPNPEPRSARGDTPIASPIAVQPPRRTKGHFRNRSSSDGASMFPPGHTLSEYHPARSLNALLDIFGPLVFPLHRAALLRKRILISCQAPVHETCNFVYDLSVLSNIPQSVADLLPAEAPTHRLRPLFTIGVHDIPALMQEQTRREGDDDVTLRDEILGGWIACTTDSILAMKDTLWDVLVTMPTSTSNAAGKTWPTVEYPGGQPIKATQRDLRRFRALKAGLARIVAATRPGGSPGTPRSESMTNPRPSMSGTALVDGESGDALDKVVQPTTWAELAYGGFMWWASAGEQRHGYEHDEAVHDASLIADWTPAMPVTPSTGPTRERMVDSVPSSFAEGLTSSPFDEEARVELAIVAFFHRLTADILTVIGEAVDADQNPYEDEESDTDSGDARLLPRGGSRGGDPRPVRIDSTAFDLMGLDVWSAADGEFIKKVAEVYFGRGAEIEGKGIEVCGLRVC
ncbi:uncharacterized protein DNG_03850 [Cephalotrichum gorgonifer]|uniref:DUF4484 domain-containing protein n=1 Tax=Cephalotrichum gorgonifer TaxID=2041049 RepID=A0AAE8MXD4_9PEZI|nr:uncharacterized protein DNG_03850 [Cephalotrichum gorgonifer]